MNAHIYTEKTVSAGTVTRTICLTVALANQLLSAAGFRWLHHRRGDPRLLVQ